MRTGAEILAAFTADLRPEDIPGSVKDLGREWETPKISFKPYPCCHYNHADMDAVARLKRKHGVTAELIRRLE